MMKVDWGGGVSGGGVGVGGVVGVAAVAIATVIIIIIIIIIIRTSRHGPTSLTSVFQCLTNIFDIF